MVCQLRKAFQNANRSKCFVRLPLKLPVHPAKACPSLARLKKTWTPTTFYSIILLKWQGILELRFLVMCLYFLLNIKTELNCQMTYYWVMILKTLPCRAAGWWDRPGSDPVHNPGLPGGDMQHPQQEHARGHTAALHSGITHLHNPGMYYNVQEVVNHFIQYITI